MVGMHSTNLFFLSSRFKDLHTCLDTNLGSNANWFLCLHLVVIAFSTEDIKKGHFNKLSWEWKNFPAQQEPKFLHYLLYVLFNLLITPFASTLSQCSHSFLRHTPMQIARCFGSCAGQKIGFSCGINTTSMRLCSHQIRCCIESQRGCVATVQHWGVLTYLT